MRSIYITVAVVAIVVLILLAYGLYHMYKDDTTKHANNAKKHADNSIKTHSGVEAQHEADKAQHEADKAQKTASSTKVDKDQANANVAQAHANKAQHNANKKNSGVTPNATHNAHQGMTNAKKAQDNTQHPALKTGAVVNHTVAQHNASHSSGHPSPCSLFSKTENRTACAKAMESCNLLVAAASSSGHSKTAMEHLRGEMDEIPSCVDALVKINPDDINRIAHSLAPQKACLPKNMPPKNSILNAIDSIHVIVPWVSKILQGTPNCQ